jgi:hypothetical protein
MIGARVFSVVRYLFRDITGGEEGKFSFTASAVRGRLSVVNGQWSVVSGQSSRDSAGH